MFSTKTDKRTLLTVIKCIFNHSIWEGCSFHQGYGCVFKTRVNHTGEVGCHLLFFNSVNFPVQVISEIRFDGRQFYYSTCTFHLLFAVRRLFLLHLNYSWFYFQVCRFVWSWSQFSISYWKLNNKIRVCFHCHGDKIYPWNNFLRTPLLFPVNYCFFRCANWAWTAFCYVSSRSNTLCAETVSIPVTSELSEFFHSLIFSLISASDF